MKHIFTIFLLALMLGAPIAHAQKEFDTQYYTFLRGTCKKNNVERAWNRWFGDKQKDLNEDICCMDSITAMEKTQSLEAKDGACPDGLEKKSLECPTSKVWCEKKTQ